MFIYFCGLNSVSENAQSGRVFLESDLKHFENIELLNPTE